MNTNSKTTAVLTKPKHQTIAPSPPEPNQKHIAPKKNNPNPQKTWTRNKSDPHHSFETLDVQLSEIHKLEKIPEPNSKKKDKHTDTIDSSSFKLFDVNYEYSESAKVARQPRWNQ